MVALTDDFDHQTELCLICDDGTPDIMVSVGDQYTMEILSITGNSTHVNFTKGEKSVEKYFPLDKRTETNILYTDWDFWALSIAEDWSWAVEAQADPLLFFSNSENLENFTTVIIYEVETDVFNTYFERYWTFNSTDEVKSYKAIQHVEYALDTGVISLLLINNTQTYWSGTVKQGYEETILEKSEIFSTSESDNNTALFKLKWLVVPLTMIVIQKRRHL